MKQQLEPLGKKPVPSTTHKTGTSVLPGDTWRSLDSLASASIAQKDAMRRHFRSEAGLRKALDSSDANALAAVPGITAKRAASLIREAHGVADLDGLCATPSTRKVLDAVLERLQSFASTPQGRSRLRMLAPHDDEAAALASITHVMAWKARVSALDRPAVRRLLRLVRLPTPAKPRMAAERIVICMDADDEQRLKDLGAGAWVHITGKEGLEEAGQYPLVLVSGEGHDVEADQMVDLAAGCGLAEVAPEAIITWFETNREILRGLDELAKLLGRPTQAQTALTHLETARRTQVTPADLAAAVEEVRKAAEVQLRGRVAALSLRGDEILQALGARMPASIEAVLRDTIAQAHRELRQKTGCTVQPLRPGFPVLVDEKEVEQAQEELETSGRMQAFAGLTRVARQLAPLIDTLTAEAKAWLEFDADFALGCFALEHDLMAPRFGTEFIVAQSVHLDLADPAGIRAGRVQAIHYRLGGDHPVAVLTGANSGGKTTLLEHLCQVATMARLGLPVVGNVEVPWFEEVHYVTPRKGLDAGAFESFLRTFLPVLHGGPRRLILADEVEAVTELESAGRILAFFVDRAASQGLMTVLVSHMAPAILQHSVEGKGGRIRVDGIEATGLDERHRLIVDRVPRMGHFARSTPELIVQRLAATTQGPDGALFAQLAHTLGASSSPTPLLLTPNGRGKGRRGIPVSPQV